MQEIDPASLCIAVRRAGAAAGVVQQYSVNLGSCLGLRLPIMGVPGKSWHTTTSSVAYNLGEL